MKKRKAAKKPLVTYPSIAQMVAATTSPKFAIKFVADMLHALQLRVRTLELKVAVLGAEAGGPRSNVAVFRLGTPGKPIQAKELLAFRDRLANMTEAEAARLEEAVFGKKRPAKKGKRRG